jgi:hypothetical protein
MNHKVAQTPEKEKMALRAWEKCGSILALRWAWSIVWVEPWQLPLAWPGYCRARTLEVLLDREMSLEATLIAIACEAKQASLYEAGQSSRDDTAGRQFARWFFVAHGVGMVRGGVQ